MFRPLIRLFRGSYFSSTPISKTPSSPSLDPGLVLPTTVIALAGKRKAGKDAIAAALMHLLEQKGVAAVRGAFADEVKRAYLRSDKCTDPELTLQDLTESGVKKELHRSNLIEFGETARAIDPMVWVRLLLQRLNQSDAARTGVVVVTDLRYPLELWALKQTCVRVLCFYVDASDEARGERGYVFTRGVDDGASETALKPFMCEETLRNDKTEEIWENAAYLTETILYCS